MTKFSKDSFFFSFAHLESVDSILKFLEIVLTAYFSNQTF